MSQLIHISKTANIDLTLKRGDTLYFNFAIQNEDGENVDLSAYTSAKLQVRENENTEPVLSLSSTGNTINIDNLIAGQITIETATTDVEANTYYYDLQLSNNTITETVMSGKIYISNDYTQ